MGKYENSKKVLAGRMARSRQGKYCGDPTTFGLMRDPDDRRHLIIDSETAPVIRKIYDFALDGWGRTHAPATRLKQGTYTTSC